LPKDSCLLCSGPLERVFEHTSPPPGETRFDLGGKPYRRSILRCGLCGHLTNRHQLDLTNLYAGAYMDATYPGDRLRARYDRIMSLPPESSDNVGRVARIVAELPQPAAVLDIGSGLGVFPARMKEAGWAVTGLDPDPRAIEHLRGDVGVDAVEGDFMHCEDLGRFDLVTFNKVLEHVEDPVAMLRRAQSFLEPDGVVYIELPDGELAAAESPARQELFIEHHHAFSMASLCLLAAHAGLVVRRCERLREPSNKLTLFAFLRRRA
jgi:2-polyprenyl-3-methyl-5-hydroxy-6-metoxy-1,4-benzoquinol methylase